MAILRDGYNAPGGGGSGSPPSSVSLDGNTTPEVYNAPVVTDDGAGNAIDDNLTHRVDGSTDLVAGARYILTVEPDNPSDTVRGWLKSATTVSAAEDGELIFSNMPIPVVPVTGKLNLSFMRDSATPYAYKVYLTRKDA